MKILVLGGTVFLGYHIVESALRAGHEVTLFTRGKSHPSLFPHVEKLLGDRDGNLAALAGRRWDAVIDTSGYFPRVVRDSAALLANATNHYTFISSISAYKGFGEPGLNENAPLAVLDDPTTEQMGPNYGGLKALCEQEAERAMPGRVLVIRPGLIVGPQDPTDRFTYWPARVSRGGEVLAPGNPETQVQFIDARDLADWTIRMVETNRIGIYHATGPDGVLTMGELLESCKETTKSDASFTWMSNAFLLENEVGPWIEVPLWIPGVGDTEDVRYMLAVNVDKALNAGLTFRPLSETIRDTLAWDRARDNPTFKAGMAKEKEAELLDKWSKRLG